jgi:DtxR family transcriptional regulator, Mn-dependent transcriptional regulator
MSQLKKKTKSVIQNKGITIRDEAFSESYDEYIEAIYRLSLKNPGGWVKNKEISKRLDVKAPSVTNMLEKLSKSKYIDWKPRSGIRLTEIGRDRAKILVCNHIIVELFLSNILKMTNSDQINKIACDFEHHMTHDLTERFKSLLGIEELMKNVDNFIGDDKIPTHIETKHIYRQNEVNEMLLEIKKKLLSNPNSKECKDLISSVIDEKII